MASRPFEEISKRIPDRSIQTFLEKESDDSERICFVLDAPQIHVFPDPNDRSVCKTIKLDDPLIGKTLIDAVPLPEKKAFIINW